MLTSRFENLRMLGDMNLTQNLVIFLTNFASKVEVGLKSVEIFVRKICYQGCRAIKEPKNQQHETG